MDIELLTITQPMSMEYLEMQRVLFTHSLVELIFVQTKSTYSI